ncbi:hypothetical protein [Ferrimonas marina]|uniref:Uncharacterized protein n=1 Tax=Ferrimonas marina TaxID=299255 RepID=A0A1M5V9F7_9GAMM|nr:hypothetical protein [Ferrimonas marina]SHH71724.1 hypothetical protein SAMN02745129_2653 [Ferrimonas marina]
MIKTLLALPPIISMTHVLLAVLLHFLEVEYTGNLLLLFCAPVALVILIHLYVAIFDKSMTRSEHLGYTLTHIPFSFTFSFLSILFLIPETEAEVVEAEPTLVLCEDKSGGQCLNSFLILNELNLDEAVENPD